MRKKGSIIGLVVFVCALGLGLHLYHKAKVARNVAEVNRIVSKLNLEGIGQAISFYIASSSDPDVVPPSTLEQLVVDDILQPAHLVSPMSGRDRDKITIDEHGVLSAPSDYIYIPLPVNAPDTLIQAYEKPANYKGSPWGEGTLVLFKQRQYRKIIVEWMDIKSFQAALERTEKWLTENKK